MRTQQAFPQIGEPFVDKGGIIQQTWLQLLIALWNRTGQAPGIDVADLESFAGVLTGWTSSQDAALQAHLAGLTSEFTKAILAGQGVKQDRSQADLIRVFLAMASAKKGPTPDQLPSLPTSRTIVPDIIPPLPQSRLSDDLSWLAFILQPTRTRKGEWTPTVTFSTTPATAIVYATQSGEWAIEGSIATLAFTVAFTPTLGPAAGNLLIAGMPIAPQQNEYGGVLTFLGTFTWATGAPYMAFTGTPAAPFLFLYTLTSAVGVTAFGPTNMTTGVGHTIQGSISFRII